MQYHKNMTLLLTSFSGVDWGGVRREWFELLCSALFSPEGGLFRTFQDKGQALVHPNGAQNRPPHLKLKHFEFAGRIVSLYH